MLNYKLDNSVHCCALWGCRRVFYFSKRFKRNTLWSWSHEVDGSRAQEELFYHKNASGSGGWWLLLWLCIFLDLSKAFDKEIKHYGIRGLSLEWFRSYMYLGNRQQYVQYNDTESVMLNYIIAGVPHGPLLGPLVFILLINDIPGCLKHEINHVCRWCMHLRMLQWKI